MQNLKIEIKKINENNEEYVASTFIVQRVKRKDLQAFITLQGEILEDFMFFNTAFGSFIADNNSYKKLISLCKIIPVLGHDYLPLEEIEDDYDLMIKLFMSDSWNGTDFDDIVNKGFKPSLLSTLNKIDFSTQMGKSLVLAGQRREKAYPEMTQLLQKTE
jgi:hypothetical protein